MTTVAVAGAARPATSVPPLRATTTALDPQSASGVDLLAAAGEDGVLWQQEDHGLAGRGAALRIELPNGLDDGDGVSEVTQLLGLIRTDDRGGSPGRGPVALGALPFSRSAAGALVVPAVTVGRAGGQAWVTTVAPEDADAADRGDLDHLRDLRAEMVDAALTGRRPDSDPPDEFTLRSQHSHADWRQIIGDAVAAIRAGQLDKVVLARRVEVETNRPVSICDVLGRLLALYPSCMVFRVGPFVGASPELLVDRRGDRLRSHPLAGTVARSGDLMADEALVAGLLGSAKERAEHAFVIDAIGEALGDLCTWLQVPAEPSVLGLRNVSHLATLITGRLAPGTSPTGELPTALDLVARLHPTPAVGGSPSAAARAYINAHEGLDRGTYAGPVGWVDANGDGTWALGIRSAMIDGSHASLYAGVGVVAGSEPHAELAETQLKLQALLAAVVRP